MRARGPSRPVPKSTLAFRSWGQHERTRSLSRLVQPPRMDNEQATVERRRHLHRARLAEEVPRRAGHLGLGVLGALHAAEVAVRYLGPEETTSRRSSVKNPTVRDRDIIIQM